MTDPAVERRGVADPPGYRWHAVADSRTSTSGPPAGDLTGQLLAGRYRLTQRIASGGMAQVWEATDEVLTRGVAVKILHSHLAADESFVQRFRAEAVAAARLAHPSIVSIYDTFHDQGVEAIVMELVLGSTLRTRLDAQGPLAIDEVLAIGAQIADALAEAHHRGLVHRDVKPANILLSVDGRVLIADFGIAKAAETADLTSDGSMVGTAKYVAPEQVEGKPVDGRTDVYALGVVLYESLCGRAPFVAETDVATALLRLHTPPLRPRQMRAGIPRAVEDVVLRAMARDPDQRYPDAGAMRIALVDAGADPTAAPPAPPPRDVRIAVGAAASEGMAEPPPPSWVQTERSWIVPAVLLIVVAVALGVAGLLLGRTDAGHRLLDTVRGKQPAAAAKAQPLRLVGATAFDPVARDGEHDDRAGRAIDGDPQSSWSTETYKDPATVGGKHGVGLIVRLDAVGQLDQLVLQSPSGGWTASIYLVEGDSPATLAGWGPAVTQQADAQAGRTSFDLGGRRAKAALIWFTRLAPDGRGTVNDVQVTGR
ncbi:MAG: putative Serine/threonine protein kinase PrkC regulator of stationary phase [Acidimicrobiales bacterium]|nr:putative Serine/threonine protein kinase PrkC regulator of stationary phase [Acidimicrobiales bacterium]